MDSISKLSHIFKPLLAAALLTMQACGGGGGGGSSGSNSNLPLQMSFSPTSLQWSQFFGNTRELFIKVAVTGTVSNNVYVVIHDNEGIIGNFVLSGDQSLYTVHITTKANMSLGAHKGKLDILVCGDTSCTTRYGEGSLTYTAEVLSDTTTDLRPLSPATGIGDWSSDQGSPTHAGFIPMTVDPQRFSNRWLWSSSATGNYIFLSISDVISDATHGLNFVRVNAPDGSHTLIALQETDGAIAWSASTPAMGSPSLHRGKIFVAGATPANNTSSSTYAARLLAYDALNGALLTDTSSPNLNVVFAAPGSPTVVNGKVFVNLGGRNSQIVSFDENSGNYIWSSTTGGYDGIAPAADADHVYFYRPNSSFSSAVSAGLTAINANDGTSFFTVEFPATGPGQIYYNGGTPVVDGAGGVVVSASGRDSNGSSRIDRYDLAAKNLKWSIDTQSQSYATPVIIGDTVYIGAHGGIEARALVDGSLRWSWVYGNKGVKATVIYNIAATSNVIFVGTDQGVAAVDLISHETVWDYPHPGSVSLSASGLLYINRNLNEGKVAAINLR